MYFCICDNELNNNYCPLFIRNRIDINTDIAEGCLSGLKEMFFDKDIECESAP